MSATLVDLLGGRKGAKAATRLVGIGLLSIPVTAATGLVDWHHERDDPRVRRVGAVHAVGNLAAGMLYLSSYRQRRAGHRLRGMALTIAGSLVSSGAGYLGGHMAFAYGAGDGERLPDDAAIRMERERSRTSTRHSEPPSDTIVHPPADPVADQMQIAAGRS